MTCFSFIFKKRKTLRQQTVQSYGDIPGIENIKIYSFEELRKATGGFSPANKIGEGGFGSVYKGRLKGGQAVAVKVLSSESRQGVTEFLNELTVISNIVHENLVKLYGCCVERDNRILVYNYLENNSLAQTLLGRGRSNIQFSWRTRSKICIGIARGLAFLHEEVHPYIVHRDIKASNILLDKDLTPKISDFGLAKLLPANMTHVSTRVAGTIGYLAPEYAVRGQLTRKADIYSFGVLLLEIISGTVNINTGLSSEDQFLIERVLKLKFGIAFSPYIFWFQFQWFQKFQLRLQFCFERGKGLKVLSLSIGTSLSLHTVGGRQRGHVSVPRISTTAETRSQGLHAVRAPEDSYRINSTQLN